MQLAYVVEFELRKIAEQYGAHTVLLYGSFARGEATAGSDIDVLFLRDSGENLRIAPTLVLRDAVLGDASFVVDGFVERLDSLDLEDDHGLLRLCDAHVVLDSKELTASLLEKLRAKRARGPKPISDLEREAQDAWAVRMFDRMKPNDAYALYRRAHFGMEALEYYFKVRGLWFEGPKPAFVHLEKHDAETKALFEQFFRHQIQGEVLWQAVIQIRSGSSK